MKFAHTFLILLTLNIINPTIAGGPKLFEMKNKSENKIYSFYADEIVITSKNFETTQEHLYYTPLNQKQNSCKRRVFSDVVFENNKEQPSNACAILTLRPKRFF
jgi:hypothetical protein